LRSRIACVGDPEFEKLISRFGMSCESLATARPPVARHGHRI
jgi:hypothetical protein